MDLVSTRALTTCAVISVAVSVAPWARADESNEQKAERLFREAEQRFDKGEVEAACNAWSDSLKLSPKLGTLLNLALCHETVGRVATAWSEFHRGAAWAAQNGQRDRQEFAHAHAFALEPKLPRIILQFSTERQITTIEIDGEPLPEPEWALPHYLDPGDHIIAVSAPGKKRKAIEIHVLPGGVTAQTVVLPALEDDLSIPPQAPLHPKPPPPPPKPSYTKRYVGYGVTSAGVVALGVGTYFGLRAIGKRDDIGSRCVATVCDAEGAELRDDARSAATVSTVAFGVCLVTVAAGVYLVVTGKTVPREAPKPAAWVSPGPGGVVIGGAF